MRKIGDENEEVAAWKFEGHREHVPSDPKEYAQWKMQRHDECAVEGKDYLGIRDVNRFCEWQLRKLEHQQTSN
eukprot:1418774-Karenia_brevis.AAC.1